MNETATKQDIGEVVEIIKDLMGQVSDQFDKVNQRLDRMDDKYDHLINTIDSFVGRIDKYETELVARDSQFNRLLVWARKVSKKTGIPLEDF